jgi:hypothetical protein
MKEMNRELAKRVRYLRAKAASDDWHEREDAGFELRDLLEERFDEGMALTEGWVKDPSPRIQRAACLSCMQRKSRTTSERVARLLQRLEPLMADDDLYVRKCCGPFVVGYLGYTYPDQVLPWLLKQAQSRDLNVRTNVGQRFQPSARRSAPWTTGVRPLGA